MQQLKLILCSSCLSEVVNRLMFSIALSRTENGTLVHANNVRDTHCDLITCALFLYSFRREQSA